MPSTSPSSSLSSASSAPSPSSQSSAPANIAPEPAGSTRRWYRLATSFLVTLIVLGIGLGATFFGPAIMATASWTITNTAAPLNWSDPTRWSGPIPGEYPGQSATATVDLPPGAYTLNVNVNVPHNITLNFTGNNAILQVPSGGKLTLENSCTITSVNTISVNGGLLVNTGTLYSQSNLGATANGTIDNTNSMGSSYGNTITIDGATLKNESGATVAAYGVDASNHATVDNAGSIVIGNYSSFTLDSSSITNNGNVNVQTTSASGSFSVTGTAASSIASGQTVTSNSNINYDATQPLTLNGTINNQSGGSINLNADTSIIGTGSITNTGHLYKSAGTGSSAINVAVANNGTVQTNTGAIALGGGGSSAAGNFVTGSATSDNIDFAGGTFTFSGASSMTGTAPIRVTGGHIALGSGATMPVNTPFVMTAGLIDGSGQTSLLGSFTWSGGTIAATSALGSATFDGAVGTMALAGPMSADGTVSYTSTSGALDIASGAVFGLNSTASLHVASDVAITGSGSINIASGASMQKTAGSSTMINPYVYNVGTVSANTGSILLNGGGTENGQFSPLGAGSLILFHGGAFFLGAGTTFAAGPGGYGIGGASVTVQTPITIGAGSNLTFSSGTLTLQQPLTNGSTFHWSGGTVNGSSTFTQQGASTFDGVSGVMTLAGATMTQSGGVSFSGTGNSDALEIDSGAIFNSNASFMLTSDGQILSDTNANPTFNNNSTFTHSGGTGPTDVACLFNNTGTVNITTGEIKYLAGGTDTGSYTGSTNTILEFGGGTRTISAAGSVNTSGTMQFCAGTTTISGPYSVGQNTYVISGTVNFANTATLHNMQLAAGAIHCNTACSANGDSSSWTGGTLGGNGSLTIGAMGDLDINLAAPHSLDTLPVTNHGAIVFDSASALTLTNHASITSDGSFEITTDSAISGTATESISNLGMFFKDGGSGTTNIGPPFSNSGTVNAQSGVLNFAGGFTQSAGGTELSGGGIASPTALQINGGSLSGFGTIAASVVNTAGTTSPNGPIVTTTAIPHQPRRRSEAATPTHLPRRRSDGLPPSWVATGTLAITGNYSQGGAGTLDVAIGGPTADSDYDVLAITGQADLLGTLNVTLVNSFVPANGETFQPITFGTRTGNDFATKNLPSFGPGSSWSSTYTPHALVLSATLSSDLGLTITDAADPVVANGTITYSAQITNHGPADVPTYTANFTLTGGGTITSATGLTCTTTATTANCTGSSLAASSSATVTIIVTAPSTGGTSTLSGSVSSPNNDAVPTNNAASQSTAVTGSADLTISKSGPASLVAGQGATYTVTITNNGPSDATGVSVADPTPSGLTFVGNSGGCTSTYPCSLGTIPSGHTVTITSSYVVSSNATGPISNTATVSSTTNDPTPSNNSATAGPTSVSQSADVAITKTGPTTALAGSTVAYTLTITNSGPSDAANVTVSDPTPSRLTFVSNSGACTTAFPCSLGTLISGQTVTIQSHYTVGSGTASITNSASVSSSTNDPNMANNSANVTTGASCSTLGTPSLLPVGDGTPGQPSSGTLRWTDANANSYRVFLGPAGSGCTMLFNVVNGTSTQYIGLPAGNYEWRVEAVNPGCPVNSSSCGSFSVGGSGGCAIPAPVLTLPANGGTATSPVTFQWVGSVGASYQLFATFAGGSEQLLGTTTDTKLTASVPGGGVSWRVVATVGSCPSVSSAISSFNACAVPEAPLPSVVAETTTGQSYSVQWPAINGASQYEIDESTDSAFDTPSIQMVTSPSVPFSHDAATGAIAYFYRIRAFADCSGNPGPYSQVVRVVVVPLPDPHSTNPNVNVPVGSHQLVVEQVFVPGQGPDNLAYSATTDRPWLNVTPSTGVLGPNGVTLTVSADPTDLPNGTFTATVIVTVSPLTGSSTVRSDSSTIVSVPVSISLVTPVSPSTKTLPPANTLMIPSVGHLDGVNSQWQSDVRVANAGTSKTSYALMFVPADVTQQVKSTQISIDAGQTTALDDIIRNWYGVGFLGDSANGVLEIRPLSQSNKGLESDATTTPVTVATSRTYNVAPNGTLGQYIPAIPFGSFIGKTATASTFQPVLSLQQVAQSTAFRTNIGLVEGSGQSASVLLSVFDAAGLKLADIPVELRGGEQKQMNALLALNNITLDDGRVEAKVVAGDGRITAYASVVDNATNDPLLVSGVPIGEATSSHYVLPGVADLNNALASWRTDMRVFNAGPSAQTATLTFYPQTNGGDPVSQSITVNPGEVRSLDNVLQSEFGITNNGGAVHVATDTASNLVVTGRTYNQTPTGTYGQFIPAVAESEGVGRTDRSLQILQTEDSVRYRTNVGVAEVTGQSATIEMTIVLPDSKITPKVTFNLGPNEFRQIPLHDLGLGNVYNARVQLRVTAGNGKLAAYGSVIDMTTQDPTYVPAQ